ncbi:MAG: DUF1800 domain-containing protein [Geitlerinemataceae cyanobacterium]
MLKLRSWIFVSIAASLAGLLFFFNPLSANSATVEQKVLHAIDRLSYGPIPGEIDRVEKMGVEAYIQAQLNPDTIPLPSPLSRQLRQFDTLSLSPVELFTQYNPNAGKDASEEEKRRARERSQKPRKQAQEARLLRASSSPRQLEEVMVDFWFNHFNVSSDTNLTRLWIGSYEEDAIRPHVLGSFRDLLEATVHHPAMLFYLDNWRNSDPDSPGARGQFRGLNENYARELMELHTLGVDGGYTQDDVVALARILTGWGIDKEGEQGDNSGFHFYTNRHDASDKVLLETRIPGSGVEEVEKALDLLAQHPSTARHISYKLAQYFVADDPPKSLVDRLQMRFKDTNGDIRSVLESLFNASEFWDERYYGNKFKTPYQYIISAVRATGTETLNFQRIIGNLQQLGMPLYRRTTPDGYPNTQEAWLNPDATIRRLNLAFQIARGRLTDDEPVDVARLSQTLGATWSDNTKQVIDSSPANLKAGLMLGSPEIMYR